jgi:small subunit ribosomal protein S16
MAIKIRLRRMGRKKQAHYRIVVADSDSPRDGRFVESLGYYKPLSHPARVVVDMDRVDHWIGKGAQPSETVASLLNKVRKGGDVSVAVGEVDKEAEKKAHLEALAAKRKAEAAAAKEEEEAAPAKEEEEAAPAKKVAAKKPAAKKPAAKKAAAEASEPPAEEEVAPEGETESSPEAEAAPEEPAAEAPAAGEGEEKPE